MGGVVTRLNNNGFFLQELTPDADPDTSEGLFVAANAGFLAQIAVGQEVRLCGRVSERDGLTQLTAPEGLTLLGVRPLPPPSELRLPATPARLESLEGMLVTLPQTLTVSGNAYLGALGQLTLTGERAWQGTTDAAAGALILDDGRSTRNPAAVPYLDAAGTRRLGDTVATLLGVLDQGASDPYGGRGYRLHPIQPPTFAAANPRPLVPPRRGSLRVGALNLESYFNGDGDGNFTAERGASSPAEFARQRAQILALLGSLNADVLGLMEIENDSGPNSSLADLLTGLNAGRAPTYVAAVGGDPGQDPIRVALIYRADRLIPLGPAYTCQEAAHPQYQPLYERPPLVQTLRQQGNGAVFSVIVSHFKSRRCDGATGVEQDTGAGCYAAKRQAQAEGLRRCLAAVQAQSGSPDVILVGDLNTYPGEVPLVSLTAAGWVDGLAAQLPPPERYSYVYAAQTGLLDYALLTPSLAPQLTAAAIWHVNADEPAFLDYTLADKPVAQIKQWRAAPFRASDHDPVLLDLRLAGTWHLFLPLTTKP